MSSAQPPVTFHEKFWSGVTAFVFTLTRTSFVVVTASSSNRMRIMPKIKSMCVCAERGTFALLDTTVSNPQSRKWPAVSCSI